MNEISIAAAPADVGGAAGITETLEERLLVLRWFAGLFREAPTEETVASLVHGPAAAFLEGLSKDPALGPDINYMRGLLAAKPDVKALTAQLGVAFSHLFLGVGGFNTVAPYESCHVGESDRTFGQPTMEMDALLRHLGLSVVSDFHEPADHISVELEIAALLTATGDPQARAMLTRLDRWIPAFADACFSRDPFGFYAAAASALRAFLARECRAASAIAH
ncbi:molecular chaperone TorD family protein [Consotaella salsifontis]|uniref:TorA specific chaperone n=1 Tax=Consotaella salsifontis TaxID=1365950 RepID=A0A1T4NXY1_9HYPH|nr:molecular chaperone TorD family protein [Consotaella salsifontis]SJZ84103.1 TorA specific chaperone [Consotaella salsifontis]